MSVDEYSGWTLRPEQNTRCSKTRSIVDRLVCSFAQEVEWRVTSKRPVRDWFGTNASKVCSVFYKRVPVENRSPCSRHRSIFVRKILYTVAELFSKRCKDTGPNIENSPKVNFSFQSKRPIFFAYNLISFRRQNYPSIYYEHCTDENNESSMSATVHSTLCRILYKNSGRTRRPVNFSCKFTYFYYLHFLCNVIRCV